MGVRGLKKFKLHFMNLTCMDVYKSFWSVQCKKFQLDFLSFFAGNFAGMTIQGVVSDNHARLSELMMMMIRLHDHENFSPFIKFIR